jgi:hypothetical protein
MRLINSKNDMKGTSPSKENASGMERRRFLKGAASAAAVAAIIPLEPLVGGKESEAAASVASFSPANRTNRSFDVRKTAAARERIDLGVAPDNGDNALFSDHSGNWSKCLLHDDLGIVNQNSWNSFINALSSGNFRDFQNIIVGNPGGAGFTGTLNGPETSLAFDLQGLDSHATKIPPAPSVTSAQTAMEEVELYWGAMLRDVNFTDYVNSPLAAQAAADLNRCSFIKSGANTEFPSAITPQNLFRGQIVPGDGSAKGPYISQFMLQPTFYGAQPLSQMFQTFAPGQSFMTSVEEYKSVESGHPPTATLAFDSTPRHLRNGRSLSAFTHVDVLHQSYFTAFLVLIGIGAPLNPGNPYLGSQSQHGFGTLDPVEAAATIPEMATRALKAAWYHKWIVNLRQRPEEVGALLHAHLTNRTPLPQAAAKLHPDMVNAQVMAQTFSQSGSFLLPQVFPEGAPTHPCYPTGHGTVGGACITAIKFFFDGNQPIRPLLQAAGSDVMQASEDGLSLVPYTGDDRDSLTINGELSKLAFNVTFGHGIHSGIHFRSSSNQSILLGEETGISVLKDRALTYNEPFTIKITKFDGTTATISNQGDRGRDGEGN